MTTFHCPPCIQRQEDPQWSLQSHQSHSHHHILLCHLHQSELFWVNLNLKFEAFFFTLNQNICFALPIFLSLLQCIVTADNRMMMVMRDGLIVVCYWSLGSQSYSAYIMCESVSIMIQASDFIKKNTLY